MNVLDELAIILLITVIILAFILFKLWVEEW